MEFLIIPYASEEYKELVNLRDAVLRKPLGLSFSPEDMQTEKDNIFCACKIEGRIVGCCQLVRISNVEVKLRQMAVNDIYRSQHIGSQLLSFAENIAQQSGYTIIILNARATALSFYAKNGYHIVSGEFEEVGIPHYKMCKEI